MQLTKNDSVIITGGASGMGLSVAKTLAKTGAKLVLIDKDEDKLNAVCDELDAIALALDVTDDKEAETKIYASQKESHPLRALINCAGIAPAKKMVGKSGVMPLSDFSKVININLIGTFNMMRIVASIMAKVSPKKDNERGVIINTASVAAFEGQIGQLAYSASKGGIVSMTLPAARELASLGIRVNTIAPGLIATPLLLNMPEKVQNALSESVPFPQRLGNPEEFANLASHIIENTLINGEVIRLDGAIRMQAR